MAACPWVYGWAWSLLLVSEFGTKMYSCINLLKYNFICGLHGWNATSQCYSFQKLQVLHITCNSYLADCCFVTRVVKSLFHPFGLLYHDILLYVVLGGHSTFFALLNTFVHIVMYFYYMISAMGPKYQKYIWWKKYLTTFQMVTFIALTCWNSCCVYIIIHMRLFWFVFPLWKLCSFK
jgi:hypothetical protein